MFDHWINIKWSPCTVFSELSGPHVWRYVWFPKQLVCKGPYHFSRPVRSTYDPKSCARPFLAHGIQTQWSPCMAFTKHSGRPVWRYLWFPKQLVCKGHIICLDPWVALMIPNRLPGRFWIMGSKHSGFLVWRFQNTVVYLYGVIFDFVLGQANLR